MIYLGLILVIIGWAVQLYSRKSKEIQPAFLLLYSVGVGVLILDGYLSDALGIAGLNAVALLLALLVFYKIKSRR